MAAPENSLDQIASLELEGELVEGKKCKCATPGKLEMMTLLRVRMLICFSWGKEGPSHHPSSPGSPGNR